MSLKCLGVVAAAAAVVACGGKEDAGAGSTSPETTDASSSSSESTTETTMMGSGEASSGEQPMVEVDCNMPPAGAIGATYQHAPIANGTVGAVSWTMTGLPPGMTFSPVSGEIGGTPTEEGSFDVEVTATSAGDSGMATCTIDVGAAFSIDFGALGKPCIEPGDDISMYAAGGNGAALSCSTPGGLGNGSLPDGVTVNPDTCMIEGTIADGYGTWVWITIVEQSDYQVHVPYCATQDVLPMGWYTIDGDHSGQTGNFLEPKVGTFTPGQPISWGGGADPIVRVTGPCGPNACYYAYLFGIGASPFADVSLAPAMLMNDMNGDPIGFSHELSATGPAVPVDFESRAWVLSWNLQYCIAPDSMTCTGDGIADNGMGFLRFGTIMNPS